MNGELRQGERAEHGVQVEAPNFYVATGRAQQLFVETLLEANARLQARVRELEQRLHDRQFWGSP